MPMLILALVLVLLAPSAAAPQNAPPAAPADINVVAIGGFLGQLDGFCEQPGGTYDLGFVKQPDAQGCAGKDGRLDPRRKPEWPLTLGGLIGGRAWVDRERKAPNSVVVVTGNNQVANFTFLDETRLLNQTTQLDAAKLLASPDTDRADQTQARFQRFWSEMANLNADAIGLASEDFVRSLRDPRDSATPSAPVGNRPSIFYRWLQQVTGRQSGPPLIGSNAIVKVRRKGLFRDLNVVEKDGYSLTGIDDDESAGWLTEIKVGHPKQAGIVFTLHEAGNGPLKEVARATSAADSTSTTLAPAEGALKPASAYELQATVDSKTSVMRFQTHRALTPRQGNGDSLNGFPVVARNWIPGSPALIVNLIDPGIKALFGKDAWKWAGAGCPEDECEIDFLSPTAAMTVILQRAYPAGAKGAKPFVILISSLSDTQTAEVQEAFPEIRMVVLPPESFLLGRASRSYEAEDPPVSQEKEPLDGRLARRSPPRSYSGDLGLFSIVNGDRPQATVMMARPEWLGEVAARLSARVSYSADGEWQLQDAKAASTPVAGAALEWEPCTETADCTRFSMRWRGQSIPYGTFASYQVCEGKPASDQCSRFAELAEEDHFNVFAGDTLRRATGAELAIVPGTLVDPDGQAWLTTVFDDNHTRVLTRFTLERIIYRSFRMVRATVAGDQLVAQIDKALKSTNHGSSCIVGLNGGCVRTIDTKKGDQVMSNGRLIDARLFYSIAMPEGLAQELSLPHSEGRHHTADAVSALHERLIRDDGNGWYVAGADTGLTTRIVEQANRMLQHHDIASSLEFGYTELGLNESTNEAGAIKRTDIEFRGVTPSRTVLSKANLDIALLDYQWWAMRAVSEVDFKRRVDSKTSQQAIDNNQWSAGARIDAKLPLFKREARAYAGYFWEGELKGPPEYLTAKIRRPGGDGFTIARDASGATVFRKDPLHYQYLAMGVDVLNIWKLFTTSKLPVDVTKAALQFGVGRRHNIPLGSRIDGVDQDPALFRDKGAQGVLDAHYDAHLDSFTPGVDFVAIDGSRDQRRFQAELNLAPRVELGARSIKFGTEFRARHYPKVADSTDNSVKSSLRAKFSVTTPLARRLELVAAYERQIATVHKAGAGTYTHSKFEMTFKVPFVVRAGWGWLLR